jgi:hypothetical protein
MKVMIKKIISIITWPYRKIRSELAYRKKIKELKKRDPFIYE